MRRVSYSFGPKIPNTFLASNSTSAVTRAVYSIASLPTVKRGKGSLHFWDGSHPKRHALEAKVGSEWIHLTCYILLDSIVAHDSSS
jgi:hypothetical protein